MQNTQTTPKPQFISQLIERGEYYFLDLDANLKHSPTIACGGLEQCSLDYKIERKNFKYYGIEYIVAGQCQLTLNGVESTLSAGSLFLYSPSCHHKIVNTGDTALVKYFIDFAGDGCEEALQSSIFKAPRAFKPKLSSWITHAFQEFQDCGTTANANTQLICGHLLQYLISRLDSVSQLETTQSSPTSSTFESCKTYIESNYQNIVSAHEVADMFHISHQYLCRLFKRYCNETPSQMLVRLKLTRSAFLLEQGNLLVKEIAEKVGFEDQYYFSKRFKGYFGVSPRNYTNANRVAMIA